MIMMTRSQTTEDGDGDDGNDAMIMYIRDKRARFTDPICLHLHSLYTHLETILIMHIDGDGDDDGSAMMNDSKFE